MTNGLLRHYFFSSQLSTPVAFGDETALLQQLATSVNVEPTVLEKMNVIKILEDVIMPNLINENKEATYGLMRRLEETCNDLDIGEVKRAVRNIETHPLLGVEWTTITTTTTTATGTLKI